MTNAEALEIVLDLARQNVIEDPELADESDRQLEAITMVEDTAFGNYNQICPSCDRRGRRRK